MPQLLTAAGPSESVPRWRTPRQLRAVTVQPDEPAHEVTGPEVVAAESGAGPALGSPFPGVLLDTLRRCVLMGLTYPLRPPLLYSEILPSFSAQ